MRTLRILFAKELNATLTSPVGYTVAAVFLLVLGYTFSLTLFVTKVANLQYIFHQMYVLSILLVPVLTMRTFAEERRSETLELLLTAPVRELSVVLAKYAATLTSSSTAMASRTGDRSTQAIWRWHSTPRCSSQSAF
jgi:ABC-2 type transport system permease protein